MEIISDFSREKIIQKALEMFRESIQKILQKKSHLTLAISGGTGVIDLFKLLGATDNIPWELIHIFMLDERCVPINHHDSNYKQANDLFIAELIDQKIIPPRNVHPYIYNNFDVMDYNRQLTALGSSLDIIIAGMGEDGHIASLFPHHESIESKELGFIMVEDAPKPPPVRISSSKKLIMTAKTSILMFWGESKRNAFNSLMNESATIEDCPAKIFKDIPDSYLFTDLEASNEQQGR